jgi:hypothetical protein
MAILRGTRLGPYEIHSGIAVIERDDPARNTRRIVAFKILLDHPFSDRIEAPRSADNQRKQQ